MSLEHIIDRGTPVASWANLRANNLATPKVVTGILEINNAPDTAQPLSRINEFRFAAGTLNLPVGTGGAAAEITAINTINWHATKINELTHIIFNFGNGAGAGVVKSATAGQYDSGNIDISGNDIKAFIKAGKPFYLNHGPFVLKGLRTADNLVFTAYLKKAADGSVDDIPANTVLFEAQTQVSFGFYDNP